MRPRTRDSTYKQKQSIDARLDRLERDKGRVPVFTLATLPDASTNPGLLIYVSDALAGQRFQRSDGSVWQTG